MPIITSPPNLLDRWPQRGLAGKTAPKWCLFGVVFTLAAALFFLGAAFLLGFLVFVKPKLPLITIESARLQVLDFDQQQGLLREVAFGINAAVVNHNTRTALAFSELRLNISFQDTVLMTLASDPFVVPKRGVHPLNYTVAGMQSDLLLHRGMEDAISNGVIPFTIFGEARTHWKQGALVLVKTWTRVFCDMQFEWPGGLPVKQISCRSKQSFVRRWDDEW